MDARREADELASRCVALVVFYQHARKAHPKWPGIEAEIRAVAAQARGGRDRPVGHRRQGRERTPGPLRAGDGQATAPRVPREVLRRTGDRPDDRLMPGKDGAGRARPIRLSPAAAPHPTRPGGGVLTLTWNPAPSSTNGPARGGRRPE